MTQKAGEDEAIVEFDKSFRRKANERRIREQGAITEIPDGLWKPVQEDFEQPARNLFKAGEQSALAKFRKQVGELKKIYRNPFVHKDIDKCFPDCAEPVSSDSEIDKLCTDKSKIGKLTNEEADAIGRSIERHILNESPKPRLQKIRFQKSGIINRMNVGIKKPRLFACIAESK